MIITESKLLQIIEEETLIYRALQEGLLDEGIASELKRLAVRYGLPLAAVLSIWTSTMKGDPIQISPEAEAAGLNQDVAAQVVQDLPVERPRRELTQADIKDFLDNATSENLSFDQLSGINMLTNLFNAHLGSNMTPDEFLFKWYQNGPDKQKEILDGFPDKVWESFDEDGKAIDKEEIKNTYMYDLEQIKLRVTPIKFKDSPPSFEVPKPPTGIA